MVLSLIPFRYIIKGVPPVPTSDSEWLLDNLRLANRRFSSMLDTLPADEIADEADPADASELLDVIELLVEVELSDETEPVSDADWKSSSRFDAGRTIYDVTI